MIQSFNCPKQNKIKMNQRLSSSSTNSDVFLLKSNNSSTKKLPFTMNYVFYLSTLTPNYISSMPDPISVPYISSSCRNSAIKMPSHRFPTKTQQFSAHLQTSQQLFNLHVFETTLHALLNTDPSTQ